MVFTLLLAVSIHGVLSTPVTSYQLPGSKSSYAVYDGNSISLTVLEGKNTSSISIKINGSPYNVSNSASLVITNLSGNVVIYTPGGNYLLSVTIEPSKLIRYAYIAGGLFSDSLLVVVYILLNKNKKRQ